MQITRLTEGVGKLKIQLREKDGRKFAVEAHLRGRIPQLAQTIEELTKLKAQMADKDKILAEEIDVERS